MDAQIISMNQWKAEHSPIAKLMEAQQRATYEWWRLWFNLWRI